MWEELKTFIEVVEQQSFTKAAQKLIFRSLRSVCISAD